MCANLTLVLVSCNLRARENKKIIITRDRKMLTLQLSCLLLVSIFEDLSLQHLNEKTNAINHLCDREKNVFGMFEKKIYS